MGKLNLLIHRLQNKTTSLNNTFVIKLFVKFNIIMLYYNSVTFEKSFHGDLTKHLDYELFKIIT